MKVTWTSRWVTFVFGKKLYTLGYWNVIKNWMKSQEYVKTQVWRVISYHGGYRGTGGICEDTSMEGYFIPRGISGDWFKGRVVQKLPTRLNELVQVWEVHWADGDNRDTRKNRWQLRTSTEVVQGQDINNDVGESAVAEGETVFLDCTVRCMNSHATFR